MQVDRHALLSGLIATLCTFGAFSTHAETIRLRIASGHPAANTYVSLMQSFFVPEVTRRVAANTPHRIEFVEGYGGSMVNTDNTLEGVQSGLIDIGGYCFCFESQNLPLHSFQAMLPFGPADAQTSVKLARAVYDKTPYLSSVLERRFNQKLLALAADNGYNLGTVFEWQSIADLKGHKLAGAGINVKWLEHAGAATVQTALPDAYAGLEEGRFDGYLMFPSGWVNFRLYEVGKHYTEVGFGAITWHGLTINRARFNRLPKDVQHILVDVARDYEARTGMVNKAAYARQIEQLKNLGTTVKAVPQSVRHDWAYSLRDWPQQKATELDRRGLPASYVLRLTLSEAERLGYKWPVRYTIR